MDYLEWNNLIAKHFFNDTRVGREVFLYVNDEFINSLGKKFSCGVDDFIKAIKQGSPWVKNVGICSDALQTLKGWRHRDYEYPPYIGYLAFFVLSAVTETDFAPNSYYPGFWKRLGEKQDMGTPPSFHRMRELWHDLEVWSREDKREELGRFVARIRGGYSHVGLPWSQTLLSEDERKYLPNFFNLVELDPTDPPSPEVLCKLLIINGKEIFKKRTMKLLYNYQKNIELRNALTHYVLDELEDWDGTIQYRIKKKDASSISGTQPVLRICIVLDSVARTVKSYLRFKTPKMFPEDGLVFKYKDDDRVWSCNEEYGGWSQPFRCFDERPPERLDASLLDWNKGVHLSDEENKWRTRLRGVNTRVFRLKLDGLPDWVESQQLERGIEFLVACYGEDIEKVINWGHSCCEIFEERDYSGMPVGWKLFYGKNATESYPEIDALFISSSTRLILRGGIKADRHNHYFNFAPPEISLQNSFGKEKVKLNGKVLSQKDEGIPIWLLPKDVPVEVPLRIEVEIGDQYQRKNIWLVNFNMPSSFNTPCKDQEGKYINDEFSSNFVCGAVVKSDLKYDSYPNLLPVHLSDRIVFIGEKHGEIVDWPSESLPKDWHPIWAIIQKGRREWKVHYCGDEEHAKAEHCPCKHIMIKENLRKWRKAIWINRKITKPPDLPVLKTLWKKYEEVAKNI